MATKLALLVRRPALVTVALLVAAAAFGGVFGHFGFWGHGPVVGLWDGPV